MTSIAVLLLVVLWCMCCVQWWILGWLPPMRFWVFGYPTKQVLMGKQWSISQLVKSSLNWLLQPGEKPANLRLLRLLSAMSQFLIYFFLRRKLKCKSSKSYAYSLPSPAAQGTSWWGRGGWVNLLEKENLWQKSFYLLMQSEVIKYCEIFYKYLKYC